MAQPNVTVPVQNLCPFPMSASLVKSKLPARPKRHLDLSFQRDSFNDMRNLNAMTLVVGVFLGVVHVGNSSSWDDGYHWGRSPAGVRGCSRAQMISDQHQRDNLASWTNGCEAGIVGANILAMHPGTSVSGHCANVLYSHPPKGTGGLESVVLQIDKRSVSVRFFASAPWNMSSVAQGDGNIQWSFTEWVPHHRPIIEDNHGGTLFPANQAVSHSTDVPSRYVYFRHFNQTVTGTYAFSPMMVELVYPAASLRELGIHTPFTWVGSEGLQRCSAVIER